MGVCRVRDCQWHEWRRVQRPVEVVVGDRRPNQGRSLSVIGSFKMARSILWGIPDPLSPPAPSSRSTSLSFVFSPLAIFLLVGPLSSRASIDSRASCSEERGEHTFGYCSTSVDTMSLLPKKTADLVEQMGLIPHPEGGFFLETHRSGAQPMTTRGQTAFDVDPKWLVDTTDRREKREDPRRNALTSIFWIPTVKSPNLMLFVNLSDHVHYYQGGKPFHYITYDPSTKALDHTVLGPDLKRGQKLQFGVPGGVWKCGYLVMEDDRFEDIEYSVIGEAVGPGFDLVDCRPLTEEDLATATPEAQGALHPYLLSLHQKEELDFDSHYDADDKMEVRTLERA